MTNSEQCLVGAPSAALIEPSPEALIPTALDRVLGLPDLASPSYWLMQILNQVCGGNPIENVLERYAGDWEGLARAASATRGLADFYDLYATQVRDASTELTENWTGDAATAALSYLGRLRTQVILQADELHAVAKDLDQVAYGMDAHLDGVVSLLGILVDRAIVAGISAAATTAAGATVVGAVVGGVATAAAIASVVQAWLTLLDYISRAVAIVKALTGTLSGLTQGVDGFSAVPLPDGT